MSKQNPPKTLGELRNRALPRTQSTSGPANDDLKQEVREMRVKVELLCEEIRALRRDMHKPPQYSARATAPTARQVQAYPALGFPIPENRFG